MNAMSGFGFAIVVAVLLLPGLCALKGWTADTRDPRYSAGRVPQGRDHEERE
jgi:hypothetical protein